MSAPLPSGGAAVAAAGGAGASIGAISGGEAALAGDETAELVGSRAGARVEREEVIATSAAIAHTDAVPAPTPIQT